jgi:lambda family phage portal protein
MSKPRYTMLDKLISYFDPSAGLRRALARNALVKARAYEGASVKDGWIPRRSGASANADHQADAVMLRSRARSLVQNNPYAAKALNCLVSNVIGEGITPESSSGDERVKAALQKAWNAWVRVADADGLLDFYGLQALAYRAMEQDGEVLVRVRWRRPEDRLPVPMQLQVLEIDYLDTTQNGTLKNGGEIISGVEIDPVGRVVAYWLYDSHPGDGLRSGGAVSWKSRRVSAESIIHLFSPDRPGQRRGITRFAPVIARLRDLAIYEDAELARKQNEALLSVFVSGDGQDFAIPNPGESSGTAESRASALGELGTLRPGAIMATNGQSVTIAEPKPAPGYADYLRMQLYAIAAGTGVTYEMLTGDLSQVNFASGRMGTIEFRRSAEQRQWQVIIPILCSRVWHAFVDACVIARIIQKADYAVEWTCPKWGYVNPVQDVEADTREIGAGLSSMSEKLRQRGYQPDRVFAELGEDYKKLRDSGAIELITLLAGKVVPTDNAQEGKNGTS